MDTLVGLTLWMIGILDHPHKYLISRKNRYMKLSTLLLEAVTDYTLQNYTTIPGFTDLDMGKRYKLGSTLKLSKVPNENVSRIFKKYKPGTLVQVIGRALNKSGQHYVIVNPQGTDDVYKIYGYYLQDPAEDLKEPTVRLKKRLTGDLQCGNCGSVFSLSIPNGKHRDHCPVCLYSVHIDNRPGDRNAWCGQGTHDNWSPSKLVPVGVTELQNVPSIVYKCEKCGAVKINKYAPDDSQSLITKLPTVSVKKIGGKNIIAPTEKNEI